MVLLEEGLAAFTNMRTQRAAAVRMATIMLQNAMFGRKSFATIWTEVGFRFLLGTSHNDILLLLNLLLLDDHLLVLLLMMLLLLVVVRTLDGLLLYYLTGGNDLYWHWGLLNDRLIGGEDGGALIDI